MSGYLQRLVRSAIQPVERVHPMMGSIYAPQPGLPEPGIAESSVAMDADRSQSSAPREFAREEHRMEEAHSNTQAHPTELSPSRTVRREQKDADDRPPTLFPSAKAQPVSPIRTRGRIEDVPPAHKTEDIREGTYAPLMPATAVRSEQRAPQIQAAPLTDANRASQRAKAEQAFKHEPDDIQIHIGRIEVLAVPQTPTPVAATKTSVTALSLADYLRRRDGRAQ